MHSVSRGHCIHPLHQRSIPLGPRETQGRNVTGFRSARSSNRRRRPRITRRCGQQTSWQPSDIDCLA